MVGWNDFAELRPDLAEAGKGLLYQHGVGLAFLATVASSGGPRVHPICPILAPQGLYAFIVPSPKQADLLRSGIYALHSFPRPDNEDAFYITGEAQLIERASTRSKLSGQFVAERARLGVPPPGPDDLLFIMTLSSCLLTRTMGHGDPSPDHTVWNAP